jgi:hypothetical protein
VEVVHENTKNTQLINEIDTDTFSDIEEIMEGMRRDGKLAE